MPKKRSEIWNHFSPEENRAAKCGYCHKTLSLVGGSTGNLMRHLRLKHPDLDIQFGQGIIIQEQSQLEGSSLSPKPEISIAESLRSKLGSCYPNLNDQEVEENAKKIYYKPWPVQYVLPEKADQEIKRLFDEGEIIKVGDEDVVECITSQSQEVKPSHNSSVSALRKRKFNESTPGKDSPSVRTSMAYEDLVKIVCSGSKQGNSNEDNFDLVGKNVAMKLRTMEGTQKAIAERLIGEILFQGQMEMLAINTTITTPNSNNMTTSTPLRSIVINAASAIQTRRDVQEQPKTTYIITPHEGSES